MINFYSVSSESEQLRTLSNLCNMLDKFYEVISKSTVFGGDFNGFFKTMLEVPKENPFVMKRNVRFVWYLKNKETEHQTLYVFSTTYFRLNSKKIRLCLFLMFYWNLLQNDVLAPFSTNLSPIIFFLANLKGLELKIVEKHFFM